MSLDLNTLSVLTALSADGFVSAFNRTDDRKLKSGLFERLMDRRRTLKTLEKAAGRRDTVLVAIGETEKKLVALWDDISEAAESNPDTAIEMIVRAEQFLTQIFEQALAQTPKAHPAHTPIALGLEEIGTGEFVRDHIESIPAHGGEHLEIQVKQAA